MVREVAEYIIGPETGVFIDLTCGGGGHLNFLSGLLSEDAHLIGIDQDIAAIEAAEQNLKSLPQKVTVININFSRFEKALYDLEIERIDGALMDLGLSSPQIDTPDRGFSFMTDGPLDMRMNKDAKLTASDIVNSYDYDKLKRLFKFYGEEAKPARPAKAVVEAREKRKIETTSQLADILARLYPANRRNSSLARLFQALRIEVNGEIERLKKTVPSVISRLNTGGRMVVLSYHSLEDRVVKRCFASKAKAMTGPSDLPPEISGTPPEVKILTRKVIKPSAGEVDENPRARSARLRAVEKL